MASRDPCRLRLRFFRIVSSRTAIGLQPTISSRTASFSTACSVAKISRTVFAAHISRFAATSATTCGRVLPEADAVSHAGALPAVRAVPGGHRAPRRLTTRVCRPQTGRAIRGALNSVVIKVVALALSLVLLGIALEWRLTLLEQVQNGVHAAVAFESQLTR